jgi:outer membrane protein assembly factor BamD (BamD/ComL family)
VAAPRPQEQALDSTASVAARGVSARKSASRSAVVSQPASSAPVAVQQPSSNKPALSEVELLRRARAALSAHPREAFEITQEHRALYPSGMFAQERDALAIEALMRTGDTNAARELAAQFVRAHPNSAHAHRFRETLGL